MGPQAVPRWVGLGSKQGLKSTGQLQGEALPGAPSFLEGT